MIPVPPFIRGMGSTEVKNLFTVVICSKTMMHSIKNNYAYILDLISKNPDCCICVWDPSATRFEDALPDLTESITGRGKWRAVVVQDGETFGRAFINKRNPFDVVGSLKVLQDFQEADIFTLLEDYESTEDQNNKSLILPELQSKIDESVIRIKEYRQKKLDNYISSVENPLTRLGVWLTGIPNNLKPEYPEIWPEELEEPSDDIDIEYYSALMSRHMLATELEQYYAEKSRYNVLVNSFESGAMVERRPESIVVFGERDAARASDVFKASTAHREELEYSNFCDDNMYSERMRFIFFDVRYENDIRSYDDYLAFISLVALLADKEVPEGTLNPGRVYKSSAVMDKNAVKELFSKYLAKLKKTKMLLTNLFNKQRDFREKKNISPEDAMGIFEANANVPVVIRSVYKKEDFQVNYHGLGLAKDCPKDEYSFWYDQVTDINKKFLRYLREPRRAVKVAVQTDFRDKDTIDDERIWKLDEFQREDIRYKLYEEEQKMIETTTTNLFDTAGFTKMLDEADNDVRKKISQRMTRNTALIVGGIAIVAYLIGFLTLMFQNIVNVKTFVATVIMIGICLGIFAVCGITYLFVMKKRLKDRMKHFNYEMSGILNSIDDSMKSYSTYLGHACNVMREFSVFNCYKKNEDKKLNTIKKHIRDIDVKIKQIKDMFACYEIDEFAYYDEIDPYSHDFTLMRDYSYDMPYSEVVTKIEFLLKGNNVEVPLDYIQKVTLTREELYD
jgi:ribosomal protein L21E